MPSLPSSDPTTASVAPAQSKTSPSVVRESQKSNISEQRRAQNVMVKRAIHRTHNEASKERMLGRRLLFTASKTVPGLEDVTKMLGSSPLKHCPKIHVEAADETQDVTKSELEKEEMDEDQGRKRRTCVKLLCQLFVLQRRQNLLVCGLSKADRLQYERDQEKKREIVAKSTDADSDEPTKSET